MKPYVRVRCPYCGGHGVVSDYGNGQDFYGPKQCPNCADGGVIVYESGAVAQWPGGPLAGRWPGEYERAVQRQGETT